VVDGVAFRDGAVVLQRVDVVVGGADTQRRFQQSGCDELELRRNNQLAGLGSNQQTTFVGPTSDLDYSRFEGRFVQVSRRRRTVAVGAARDQRVSRREQGLAVTIGSSNERSEVSVS
jgi:hypothetical protein